MATTGPAQSWRQVMATRGAISLDQPKCRPGLAEATESLAAFQASRSEATESLGAFQASRSDATEALGAFQASRSDATEALGDVQASRSDATEALGLLVTRSETTTDCPIGTDATPSVTR